MICKLPGLASFLIIGALCLSSCLLDNFGYPKRITFDKEGGTKTIPKNTNTICISIVDDGKSVAEIKIMVLPNDTRRKRKLYLDIMVLDLKATIDIIQR